MSPVEPVESTSLVKVQSFIRKRGFKSWLGLKPPDVMLGVVACAFVRVWDFTGARSVLHFSNISRLSDLTLLTFL